MNASQRSHTKVQVFMDNRFCFKMIQTLLCVNAVEVSAPTTAMRWSRPRPPAAIKDSSSGRERRFVSSIQVLKLYDPPERCYECHWDNLRILSTTHY